MRIAIALLAFVLSISGLSAQTVKRDTVHFEFDKFDLKPDAQKTINALAALANQKGEYRVTITGHTDDIGGDAYNDELARNRVNAVKDYFMLKGIPQNKIIVSSYGEHKPLVPNDDKSVRAANRRVEIALTFPDNKRTTVILINQLKHATLQPPAFS